MKTSLVKKIFILVISTFLMFACERRNDRIALELTADVVAFDQNCSTCILAFPGDYLKVQKEIGISPGNMYNAINMNKDNFQIGQKLRVTVRKPEANEFKACLTMFPSDNYQNIFVADFNNFNNLIFNDTVEISNGDCLYDPGDRFYICMESVLGDSRCPTGAYCFWEGNAKVRFKYEKVSEDPVLFNLNTHRGFTNDTIIDSYKFSLAGLSPYPSMGHAGEKINYKAQIIVSK